MAHVKIFADSTSDLHPDWIRDYQIGIIPLYVVFDHQTYKDGLELNPKQLYDLVGQTGKLPKTAAPSPADFIASFQPYVDAGDHIICITLSSELSSTYQNAVIAAGEFPEGTISIVDSLNLSAGIGLQVLKAAQLAENGATIPEILSMLEQLRPKVDTEFVIDSLDYLHKGGRCSGMQNFVGSLLKIRPVIKVIMGKMTPAYKVRGSREKALDQMRNNALSYTASMDNDTIIVVHTMAEAEAKELQLTLQQHTKARQVLITEAGCVICSHCGPKTIGIIYASF
ncbi:DegV family protein with EDD domain [Paenibacillus shirakamiensis]|uniref:DegV family protein with EDD domain n=1 Tax=Paenibacillus shirakamiensis TaxID=1265935 RepID=A0ABS4JLK7_9BACL|nr:DegV family protein [Paenibacillus shirakamiensis]MBP2002597.1 DegV family protein with EDD domain [Paenibacillus shirakamiensis]